MNVKIREFKGVPPRDGSVHRHSIWNNHNSDKTERYDHWHNDKLGMIRQQPRR